MNSSQAMKSNPALSRCREFSLVQGGLFFGVCSAAGLGKTILQSVPLRTLALTMVAWAPLLLLSLIDYRRDSELSFLIDIELHLRFLVAMPLLIWAEPFVHTRLRPLVLQFIARDLVPVSEREKFDAIIDSNSRLRNAMTTELPLVLLVYAIGILFTWRLQRSLGVSTWYGTVGIEKTTRTMAGWWLVCVSLPLFQFLLLRWYLRIFLWARLLWQLSRLNLKFYPTHPDQRAGLGFLSLSGHAFAPILFAQGVLLAGMISTRIMHAGAKLTDFKLELMGLVTVMVFAALGPLLVFTPKLAAVKRRGLREYGTLAQTYVRQFDQKWLRTADSPDRQLIGNQDIQSLADIGTSFAVIVDMTPVIFTAKTLMELTLITVAPVLPLLLTMIPLEEVLTRLVKVVF